jgi:hypothetical protein
VFTVLLNVIQRGEVDEIVCVRNCESKFTAQTVNLLRKFLSNAHLHLVLLVLDPEGKPAEVWQFPDLVAELS